MRKYEEGSFPLIRARFRQFVKRWPRATSHQEVGHGTTRKQRVQMAHNDALHHPRQAAEGCRWAGAGRRAPGGEATKPAAAPSTQAQQRKRVALTSEPVPPETVGRCLSHANPALGGTGVFRPWGPGPCAPSPLRSATWEGPCCPGGRPAGLLLCHRLHTPLGRRKVEPFAKYAKKEGR